MQLFLKILANSTSYGVYIEMNREELEDEQDFNILGLKSFSDNRKRVEKNGKFYNPLIAAMITGAARLILAMMEKTVLDLGGNFAFCDTDSMAIMDLKNDRPENIGEQVVEKFKSLLPYDFDGSLLVAEDYNWERINWNEKDKDNTLRGKYYPLYCYMVSAKRYVLYNLIPDGEGRTQVVIRKKSDHGLGHLLSPNKRDKRNDWINEVWKRVICLELGLPYDEPEWFDRPALAHLSISKPLIYDIFNREILKPYNERVKPSNFMLVAYPAEDVIFGTHTITSYYCKLHKAIGMSHCRNKSACKHVANCYANLNIIPITAYDSPENYERLNWLDKNTKTPIKIKLSRNKSEQSKRMQTKRILSEVPKEYKKAFEKSFRNEIDEFNVDGVLTIKNYFDFIGDYNLHPELKYDAPNGEPCGKHAKGLLKRTHVHAAKVKHIGKETNTIQDKEEEAIIPDELNWDDTILTYDKESEEYTYQTKIDGKQWLELLPTLKEKAKPRTVWAKSLGIKRQYFYELLQGKNLPSPELYNKILEFCEIQGLKIPISKIPAPSSFKNNEKGCILPIKDLALQVGVSIERIKTVLSGNILVINGLEYVNINTEVAKKVMGDWNRCKRQERKEAERQALAGLKVQGYCLTGKDSKSLIIFDVEEVTNIQVTHEKGRSYKTLNVKLRDGNIYRVLIKDNPLVFKYRLLPRASQVAVNPEQITTKEKQGFQIEYGPWMSVTLSWLNENLLLRLYGISKKMLLTDLEAGKIAANAIMYNDGGKIMINSLTAFKFYNNANKR